MITKTSEISCLEAKEIVSSIYGIEGELTKLVGYADLNFLVKTPSGEKYILKITQPDFDTNFLDFQEKLLQHLNDLSNKIKVPRIIQTRDQKFSAEIVDTDGQTRHLRLLSWIDGRLWSSVNPITDRLRHQLGIEAGKLTTALNGFKHPFATREFEWDTATGIWTRDYLQLFSKDEKETLIFFQDLFEQGSKDYKTLRKSIIHNDVNDNNILVSDDLINSKVEAIIDFGDAIYTQTINDLAIACTYAIMDCNDPLECAADVVMGYNEAFSLEESELSHLYTLIGMRLVISVTKSAIGKKQDPNNEYLLISEKPAWTLLHKWRMLSEEFAHYTFREACGFTAHPAEQAFKSWSEKQHFNITDLIPAAASNKVFNLDLSIGSRWAGHEKEIADLELFQFKLERLQADHPDKVIAGGYTEARGIYSSEAYDKLGNYGKESRTIHMGIDFWFPPGTAIHTMFDGEVVCAVNDEGNKEYGGLVILKHTFDELEFYTLYGHNTVKSVLKHSKGDLIKKGDKISELGNYPENGNWAAHLHFQIMLSMLDYKNDFPGVVYQRQLGVWKSLLPDPNLLFKNDSLDCQRSINTENLIDYRKKHLGKSLSLQYNSPLKIVRGSGQYLIDQNGRKFLDTVNNVAHVGHENYNVVKAGQKQMAILNTNTRYLHESINSLTEELLSTFPKELSVVHYVNSGSEANELALRMVNAVTNSSQMIASEVGYHGNTNAAVAVSSYKFEGKGGKGAPNNTHIFPMPDAFRGKYRGTQTAEQYAKEIDLIIERLQAEKKSVGGLILEPILSCGGQIELPKGFLKMAYKSIREAGGVCISDEVQTGCGRVGQTFWGFQLHDVVPDIVTIGKPFGNGHPVAAVVCTNEVAEAFANGMEYFNTFGGNPVSCEIAKAVLAEIKGQNLQAHALEIGNYLKDQFKELSEKFPIIGDVRGQGLFLGVELVDSELKPLPEQTSYLIDRMKEHGILMSSDGRDDNVIKIKPPMVFNKDNAKELIAMFKIILAEDYMTCL